MLVVHKILLQSKKQLWTSFSQDCSEQLHFCRHVKEEDNSAVKRRRAALHTYPIDYLYLHPDPRLYSSTFFLFRMFRLLVLGLRPLLRRSLTQRSNG